MTCTVITIEGARSFDAAREVFFNNNNMEEGTDDQKMSVDREELIRYLNGEISFTEWQQLQGQDVCYFLFIKCMHW